MQTKTAYMVATSHLDTVWRWTLADTVEKFIPDTLSKNFDLIEKYPNYLFNFEGAYRYELIEEYYPKAFKEIKRYVRISGILPAPNMKMVMLTFLHLKLLPETYFSAITIFMKNSV